MPRGTTNPPPMRNSPSLATVFLACAFVLCVTVGAAEPLTILQVSPDSGRSANDGITNTAALSVAGQAEPGATVAIKVGTRTLGTLIAGDPAGMTGWTYDLTSAALPHGLHVLSANIGSGAGARAYTYTIMVDLQAPAVPTITAASPSTGTTTSGWTTSGTSVQLSGRCEANALVSVSLDGRTGTPADGLAVLATAAGTWSVTLGGLSEGDHVLTVLAEDAAGNRSAELSRTLTVARPLPPVITAMTVDSGSSQQDRITKDVTPTFTGTAPANATITLLVDGQIVGSAKAGSTGAWSLTTSPLADGLHACTAIASFGNGLPSTPSEPFALQVKTLATAPSLGFSPDTGTPGDGVTSANALVFSGSAGDGVSLRLTLDSTTIGTPPLDATGMWSLDWTGRTIEPGIHALVATATDIAGNQTAAVLNFVVDRSPPAAPTGVTIEASPTAPNAPITAGQPVRISGQAEPGLLVQLVIDGQPVAQSVGTDAAGYWSTTAVFDAGSHAVAAHATDAAGNVGAASAPLQIDVAGAEPAGRVVVPYRARVTLVEDPNQVLGGQVRVGQELTGSYTYHVPASDSGPMPGVSTYAFAQPGEGITAYVNALAFASDPAATDFTIEILNDRQGMDSFALTSRRIVGENLVTGIAVPADAISWSLSDPRQLALADTILTALPPDLGQWSASDLLIVRLADPADPIAVGWTIRARVEAVGNQSPPPLPPAPYGVRADVDALRGIVQVSGQASPGSQVDVHVDTARMGSVLVDATGGWQLQLAGIAPGDHSITALEMDPATALRSPFSAPVQITVGGAGLPVPYQVEAVVGAAEVVYVTGRAAPQAQVEVWVDGQRMTATLSGTTGQWQSQLGGLAPGVHTITARQVDPATGASGAFSAAVSVLVVAAPLPTVSGVQVHGDGLLPGQAIPSGISVIVAGRTSPMIEVQVSIDGLLPISVHSDPLGQWEWRTNGLLIGPHTASARARDGAGLFGPYSEPVPFEVGEAPADAVITVSFQAEISNVIDPGLALEGLRSGTLVSGTYRYRLGAADGDPQPTSAAYRFTEAGLGISIDAPPFRFASDASAPDYAITLRDGDAGGDYYQMRSYRNMGANNLTGEPVTVMDITMSFADPTMRALNSTELTGQPPDMITWPSRTLTITGVGPGQQPWSINAMIRQVSIAPVQAGG